MKPSTLSWALLVLVTTGCADAGRDAQAPPAPAPEAASPATPAAPLPPPPAHAPDEAVKRLDHGIDVSVHSGSVDWPQVAASHGFAILKATEGVDLVDGAFDDHWRQAAEAGLVRGAYHFYVTEDDPHQQAELFLGKVHLQPGDLAPIVDVELIGHDTEEGWQQGLVTFVQLLQEHYGVPPIIYTGPKFWSDHIDGEVAEALAGHPLWIAEYGVEQPVVPAAWSTWHIWQYQGDAAIAGVENGADLSRVNRDGPDPAGLLVHRAPTPTP